MHSIAVVTQQQIQQSMVGSFCFMFLAAWSLCGCASLLPQGRSEVSIGFIHTSCTPLKTPGSAMASWCTTFWGPLDLCNSQVCLFQCHSLVAAIDQCCMHDFTAQTPHLCWPFSSGQHLMAVIGYFLWRTSTVQSNHSFTNAAHCWVRHAYAV